MGFDLNNEMRNLNIEASTFKSSKPAFIFYFFFYFFFLIKSKVSSDHFKDNRKNCVHLQTVLKRIAQISFMSPETDVCLSKQQTGILRPANVIFFCEKGNRRHFLIIALADPRVRQGRPQGVRILSFSCSFRQKKKIGRPTLRRPLRRSWIRHCIASFFYQTDLSWLGKVKETIEFRNSKTYRIHPPILLQ